MICDWGSYIQSHNLCKYTKQNWTFKIRVVFWYLRQPLPNGVYCFLNRKTTRATPQNLFLKNRQPVKGTRPWAVPGRRCCKAAKRMVRASMNRLMYHTAMQPIWEGKRNRTVIKLVLQTNPNANIGYSFKKNRTQSPGLTNHNLMKKTKPLSC